MKFEFSKKYFYRFIGLFVLCPGTLLAQNTNQGNVPNRIIYAYLQDFERGHFPTLSNLQWNNLTHVADFAAYLNSSGEIVGTDGTPNSLVVPTAGLIDSATAH